MARTETLTTHMYVEKKAHPTKKVSSKLSLAFGIAIFLILYGCIPQRVYYHSAPFSPPASGKYIFYLHSKIIESKGPFAKSKRHGTYNYYGILKSLEKNGFHVISEVRPENTQPSTYAKKVVSQIEYLLASGVPPENITVAGLLKGGIISLYASAIIKNPQIKYVILSGCGKGRQNTAIHTALIETDVGIEGNFLSIYDSISSSSGTCEPIFNIAADKIRSKEISLLSGLGTGLFYTPDNHWMSPMVDWIKKN